MTLLLRRQTEVASNLVAQSAPEPIDFEALAQGSALTGVVSGMGASVTGSSMVVTIASGVVRIGGRRVIYAGGTVTAVTDATNPRRALVTINNAGTLAITHGTAGANPYLPNAADIPANSVVLHAVDMPAATTALTTAMLTDKRVPVADSRIFNVQHYGATGNGSTDDTTAILAAGTAANAAGGGVRYYPIPAVEYKTTASITCYANVTEQGEGRGSIIKPTGTGFNVFTHTGSTGGSQALASNADENKLTVTMTAGGAAATGIVAGSYVRISDTTASGKSQITRCLSIAGEAILLVDPLAESFTTALTATVQRIIPSANITIRDLAIDGTNLTNGGAPAHGISLTYVRHCLLENLTLLNLLDAGANLDYGYGNRVQNIDLIACGSGNYADLNCNWQSNFQVDGVRSMRSTGFGPTFKECHHGEGSDIHSSGAAQRAFKLQACAHNRWSNITANTSQTLTGLAIVYGSHHNYFNNVETIGNFKSGIWFYGNSAPAVTADHHNILTNVRSASNVEYQVEINAGCVANFVMGEFDTSGSFDYRIVGTDNVVLSVNSTDGYHVMGELSVSSVDTATGDGVITRRLLVDDSGVRIDRDNSALVLNALTAGVDTQLWFADAGITKWAVFKNGSNHLGVWNQTRAAADWYWLSTGNFQANGGGSFAGDITVPAEAYGSGWNASNEAPTKNDVYDQIQKVAYEEIWDWSTDTDMTALSGATIQDLFGANTAITTLANTRYEFEVLLWYVRTTAGTVTFTFTNTQTYTWLDAQLWHSPAAGSGQATSLGASGIEGITTAAAALPATASQTLNTNQHALIKGVFKTGTAGNFRFRVTNSAGTMTVQTGSKFKIRRLPAGNIGSYVA